MQNANQRNDDFGFDEHDVRGNNEQSFRSNENDQFDRDDEALSQGLGQDRYEEVADHEDVAPQSPTKESFFKKYGHYLIVGGVVLVLLGGLGWVAVKVLKPAPIHTERTKEIDAPNKSIRNPANNKSAVEPVQINNEDSDLAPTSKNRKQEAFAGADTETMSGSVLPITPRTEQEQDEEFYDTLVKAAEHNPIVKAPDQVATPGQVVPPTQVDADTADKFAAISSAIANNSKEMNNVLAAVKEVSEEIKTLKTQVDAASTKTSLFEGKLNQFNLSLSALTKSTEAKFNDLSKAAVAAAVQAVKQDTGNKSGGSGKMVLVGGPMKSDYAPDKAINKHVEIKAPVKQVIAEQPPVSAPIAKPQPDSGNQATQCGAKTISQVWKVKGVTFGGAYVRRDDGSALMLRVDMEVPGFGRVKSFDPNSRTVCTTSGLIAR
jgi:hypothetical protein